MDGDQVLDFYRMDPIEAAKRFISKPKFAGKLYTKNERQDSASVRRPGKRAFGRANSGWFLNLHNSLTLSAFNCYSCSMQTKRFLESTDPTIQSIVSFQTNSNSKYV
jgi:hypothetical protein